MTYTIEQLKEYWRVLWPPSNLADATGIVPELIAELEARDRDIARLKIVCGEAYQMAGALDATEKALDNLSAASRGDKLPHDTFLPHPTVSHADISRKRGEEITLLKREIERLKGAHGASIDYEEIRQKAARECAEKLEERAARILVPPLRSYATPVSRELKDQAAEIREKFGVTK